jgi:hypothetical protein
MSNDMTTYVSPASMLQAAIEKGIDAEGIKTLAEVYQMMEAKRAEAEFNEALAQFQADCPVILKNTKIEFPTRGGNHFSSRFAAMDDIVEQTRDLRKQHGFSFSFDREIKEKTITVWCELRHRGGHMTRTPFSLPIPGDNKLSEGHAVASAVTFAERYAFRGALGITTGLPDDDGKGLTQDNEKITLEQQQTLRKLLDDTGADTPNFWKFAKVQQLDEIPVRDYARIQQALLQRKARSA